MTLSVEASRVHLDTPIRPAAAPRLLVELRERAAAAPEGAVLATLAELAETLGVAARTVQRARRDLVATGLIEVVDGADRYAPNTYRVRL